MQMIKVTCTPHSANVLMCELAVSMLANDHVPGMLEQYTSSAVRQAMQKVRAYGGNCADPRWSFILTFRSVEEKGRPHLL